MSVERSSVQVQNPAAASILSRRAVLAALLAGAPALAACSLVAPKSAPDDGPDPLIALADAARSDAAMAAAALAADPALRDRVEPLRAARAAHAAALDSALGRVTPGTEGVAPAAATSAAAPPTSAGSARTAAGASASAAPGQQGSIAQGSITQLHDALAASAKAASSVALSMSVDRVGLVASVAACCSAYASTL